LPQGAVARFGTATLRHPGEVWSLQYASRTSTLVVGVAWSRYSYSGKVPTLWLWNSETGRLQRSFSPNSGIASLAIVPPGKTAVCKGIDPSVLLVDLARGKVLREYVRPGGSESDYAISDVQLSPDGKVVAIGQEDIGIWETATARFLRHFGKLPDDDLTCLAFSPDGKRLASAHRKGGLRVWDPCTGRCLLEAALEPTRQLSFAPGGRTLAGLTQDGVLFMLDSHTGEEVYRIREAAAFASLAFSPDGKLLAAGRRDGVLSLFDRTTGKRVRSWRAHGRQLAPAVRLGALAFRPDGRKLASAGDDGLVRIWDPATGREAVPTSGHQQPVTEVACSPDGRFVLSTSWDDTVRLWEIQKAREVRCFPGGCCPHALAFSANGLACAWIDEDARCWFRLTDKAPRVTRTDTVYKALALSPDGRTVVSLSRGGAVVAWDPLADTWERVHYRDADEVEQFALSANATVAAWVKRGSKLTLYSFVQRKEVELSAGRQSVWRLFRLTSDGTRFLSYRDGGTMSNEPLFSICNRETGKALTWLSPGPDVQGATFSRTGRLVALIDRDRLRVYETASGRLVREIKTGEVRPTCLDFLPDSRRVITGNDDSTLVLWDLQPRPANGPRIPLEPLWAKLASANAATAYSALWEMAAMGDDAVAFLHDRLRPVRPVEAKRLKRLFAGLDDGSYPIRRDSARELEGLGDAIGDELRKELKSTTSAEVRDRLRRLVEVLETPNKSTEYLQLLRGVELLEHIESKKAKGLLESLAKGVESARLTREAKETIHRLRTRSALDNR
jgi:WD40 repeat protein